MLQIITDSASDITLKQAENMKIHIVPLSIRFPDGECPQEKDEDFLTFYRRLQEAEELPVTSQPSPEAYLTYYREAEKNGDDVLVLTLSSGLSGTINAAKIAKEICEYDRVFVVDTRQAILSQRIVVEYAVKLRDEGLKTEEIVENMEMEPYGFAFNKPFIDELLRNQMGFDGYINSDTGIIHNMCWGVEMLDQPERIAFAVNHAGVDLISGLFDNEYGREAYQRGKNDYYDSHRVPDGFSKEDLVLTDEALDRAVFRTLKEMFEMGMFDDPYRDPKKASEMTACEQDWENAMEAHRKSVTLLKNNGILPLSKEKLEGKRIYAEAFHKQVEMSEKSTKALRESLKNKNLTDDVSQADVAILMITPSSGEYFNATPGYLELDICEGKEVCNVDEEGRPTEETHKETTLSGAGQISEIADVIHKNGGKVIANVNFTLAWELGNVEPYVDALTAGYDTYPSAVLDVIFGSFCPVGKLPVTLPRNDKVLAVNAEGKCVSPNDVPGYDKDQYIPDELKDENGKAYAYRDQAGNYYEFGFGLSY